MIKQESTVINYRDNDMSVPFEIYLSDGIYTFFDTDGKQFYVGDKVDLKQLHNLIGDVLNED